MDDQTKKLLLETYKIAKENREYLVKIDRRQRYSSYWRIFLILLTIGSALGVYYYFEPYINQFVDAYDTVQQTFTSFGTVPDQIKGFIKK